MRQEPAGIALISVLLLLSAMLVMALTMQLLALLGVLTTRNQLAFAEAEAELHSRLNYGLLTIEQQIGTTGELPESPYLPDWISYSRESIELARLAVSSSQPPHLALEALIQLQGTRLELVRLN